MSPFKRTQPPEPPIAYTRTYSGNTNQVANEAKRRNGLVGFPWFFTKQFLGFSALFLGVLILDFFIICLFAVIEEGALYMTPRQVVNYISENISQVQANDGSESGDRSSEAWRLTDDGKQILDHQGGWALLLEDGKEIWEYRVPEDIPKEYSINEIVIAGRLGQINDYPVFFWDRDDGTLLVVGFPKGTYSDFSLHLPASTMNNLPIYVLILLSIDAAILFAYVLIRRQRTRSATVPITQALDDLAHGRQVYLPVSGDLQDVARMINEASAALRSKDEARERWIAGVSHDIRTPLSMITGYADSLSKSDSLSAEQRKEAELIRAQSLRIADLVVDLNTASRLEYDTQPLDVQDFSIATLVRSLVVEYLNDRLPEGFSLEFTMEPGAEEKLVRGDARLINRALQNLIQNAIVHNPEGCAIKVSLETQDSFVSIQVCDSGAGIDAAGLTQLNDRLSSGVMPAKNSAHGLGLFLVKRIIEVHNGTFSIEAGSGFFCSRVLLPVSQGV